MTAGTWSSIAPPSGGFPVAVDDVYAHDHGGVLEVFVALADGTVMWNAGGTWSPPTDVLFVSGGLRFVPSPDGVPPLVWQGGSLVQWDPAVENFDYRVCNGESSTISAVAVDRANRIWSHNGTMVQVCTLEDLALHRVMSAVGGMFLRLAPSPDGVAVIGAGALREFTAVTSIDDCRNWECVSPSLGSQFMYDGDEPYAAVPNDAVRTLPVGAWRSMTTLQGSAFQAVEPDSVGHLLVRGIDIIAQPQLWMMSIDGWTPKGVRAYAGLRMHLEFTIQNSGLIYEGAILASTTDESAVFDLLWSRDDSPGLVDAHAIGTGVYAAWLKDQFYWEVRPLAFPITKLAGSHVDSLYGIAATTSSLYRFDGQTWSTYADLGATPVDLWVAPDDSAWVIASDRIIHVKPGAPPIVDTTMFAGHELLAISGSAVDDVVVGGVVDVENGFSGLLRYDGTVWYEVRTPEHVGRVFDIAITGRSRYFLTVDREDRTVIRLDSWLRP